MILMAVYTNYNRSFRGIPKSYLGTQERLPEELTLSRDWEGKHFLGLPDKRDLLSVGL